MTVVPSADNLIDEGYAAVRLARYAQLVHFQECAFWGVGNSPETPEDCRPIQTLEQRSMIARYLAEAQEEIELVTQFPLAPRWFASEQHTYSDIVKTRWMKVIEPGVRAETTISAGQAVNHATDPAVVGPVATTVTDEDEIHVFHPGTDVEIDPSSVVIAGGNVTITIPRCRLVEAANVDNPDAGLDWADVPPSATSPFEATVDIVRVWNDTSVEGVLIYPHQSSSCECYNCWSCPTCAEYTKTACAYVRNAGLGLVDVLPATYSGGAWTASTCACCCGTPQLVRLSYRAGLTPLTRQVEDMVIRLAHSKMPAPPCGCGQLHDMWSRDRNVPEILDRERLNCPFGMSDGAFTAWRWANAIRAVRLGVL